jgi:hypothetical protein
LKNTVYILLILLSAIKCGNQGPNIEGVPLSQSYNNCPEIKYDFGDMITIGDPGERFMIRLPYEWDIQETYSDSLYGIIASNGIESENDPEKFMMISVTGYLTGDSLSTYFRQELNTLKRDKNIIVMEAGEIQLYNDNGYWVKFESNENEHRIMNLVQYIKSEQRNEVYLIQSSVKKSENDEEKICILKKLTDSFELVYD